MTDQTGCTFIYSEERALQMARQQSLRKNVMDVYHALEILNENTRGENWQLDTEYESDLRNEQS